MFLLYSTDPKFKQDISLNSTTSSSTSSASLSLDLHSPKEGLSVSSDLPDDPINPSNSLPIKEEISTPGPSGDFPSPSASPVSESSFPKLYQSTDDSFMTGTADGTSVSVSPAGTGKYYPESTASYQMPSTNDSASSYYVSYAGSSSYPTAGSYNTSSLHNPDMYTATGSCISPSYLGYQATATGKPGYAAWPTTPNGVGYSAFSMTPSAADMYQYQAQTYQQMANRASYPAYFTGQTPAAATATPLPNTMS